MTEDEVLVDVGLPAAPSGSVAMEHDGIAGSAVTADVPVDGMAVDIRGEAEWWSWWAAKWTTPQNMMVPDCLGR